MTPPSLMMGPSFGSMNFLSYTESFEVPIPTDHERGLLFPDIDPAAINELCNIIPQDPDIFFAIGAPAGFTGVPKDAYIVLFLDNAGHEPRELPDHAYQVTCSLPLNPEEFNLWTSRATQMIRIGMMNRGWIGLDVSDLRNVLRSSKTKQLVLHIIDYADLDQLPLPKLQALQFHSLFALLFAGDALELEHFSELGTALEDINADCQFIVLGVNCLPQSTASLLLLGEQAGST